MLRYYSHYIYIYPDIYLKNCIVETNGEGTIIKVFPFEAEIERTEFYSGLLVFYPTTRTYVRETVLDELQHVEFTVMNDSCTALSAMKYILYIETDFISEKTHKS